MVSPGHSRRQPGSTHAHSISPSGTTSLASLFKQDNSPSSIFQQRLWWMTRSQSRSLPLPRLIVHSSRVRVPGLLGVQGNQQHSLLDPPFCVNPRTPLSTTTAPNVPTWCLPPIKPLRSVPFLANQVVSLPSLSTCPILAHLFPSHPRCCASIGPRPGLRAKDPLRGQLPSVIYRR